MGRVVVVWMAALALLSGVARADVPASHQLSEDELRTEMGRNRARAAYVDRNGLPDVAETRSLSDRPPWDSYEVVLYYLDRRSEMRFARASILGRPEVQLVRSERTLSDAEVDALRDRVTRWNLKPDERAEAAARRAENAASTVETAALSAERAADRAEAVSARIESAFHSALRK